MFSAKRIIAPKIINEIFVEIKSPEIVKSIPSPSPCN
jgi:hypothetical protein